MRDHVVICNANEKVAGIVEQLLSAPQPPNHIALLTPDRQLWAKETRWHPRLASDDPRFSVVFGCPSEAESLERVHMAEAHAAIVLADPAFGRHADSRSALVAIAIEAKNPQVHTVIELIASVSRLHVGSSGVNEVICFGEISEKLIAQSCISPGVQHVFEHLLHTDGQTQQLVLLDVPPSAAGQSYRELCRTVVTRGLPLTLCGFARGAEPREFVLNPAAGKDRGKGTVLERGDQLIAIAAGPVNLDDALS